MDAERWRRIEDLLQAALDRPRADRARFLDEEVGDEPDLRREVEALLDGESAAAALSVSPVTRSLPAAEVSLTGRTLGRYRVGARIGAGGMGEVYAARDPTLQRTVALKVLPAELVGDAERVRRLEREALTASRLNHPNILTIFEVVSDGSTPYLASEHVEGRSLRAELTDPETGGPRALPLPRALDIAAQIAAALAAAHDAGIVHRDVKPENVMVRTDGLVKVLDFGIAKRTGQGQLAAEPDAPASDDRPVDPTMTAAGEVLGTHGYMSPEQARGEPLDARTDLFSLGLVLHEMLAGERYRRPSGVPDTLRRDRRTADPRAILRRLLQVDPELRYPSARDLLADLERVRARASGKVARRVATIGASALVIATALSLAVALLSVRVEWHERILRGGHTAAARQVAFAPDGRTLISVGEDGRTIVWDFAQRLPIVTLSGRRDQRVAFSPDGRWFVTGGADGTVAVWDAVERVECATLAGHRDEVGGLGFSADAALLASSSLGPSGGRTIVWRTEDWERIRTWELGTPWSALLFSPDRRELALSGGGSVLDLESGEVRRPSGLEGNWASLSPDATRLATIDARGGVGFLRLDRGGDFDRLTLTARHRGHHDHGRAIAYSPDGRLVASGAEVIVLWDARDQRKIARLEHSAVVWSLAFHPTGRWLISSHADGAVLVWDVVERELIANLSEHASAVRAVAIASDGRRIASASDDRTVLIWDARTGERLAQLAGHSTRVGAVDFLPDGSGLASADQDGTVLVWDLRQRRPRLTLVPANWAPAYALAVSADGRRLATSHGLYALDDGRRITELLGEPDWDFGSIYGVAFAPDGSRFAAVTDAGWLLLFEAGGGRRVAEHRLSRAHLVAVAFSADGESLVTGEDEGFVRLWSVAPLRQVAELGRHAARVKSVSFSPGGDVVASASDDRTIALWDVARRRLRQRIGTHATPVYGVAFSPDGRQLVSGEHDRSVRLYTRRRSLWGFPLD
jgi:WD40 repeat protein